MAQELEELKRTGGAARLDDRKRHPPGVDNWVRPFTIKWVEAKRGAAVAPSGAGVWRVFASKNHPLAGRLGDELAKAGGHGVVVCLPENPGEEQIGLLLDGACAALAMKDGPRF